MYFQTTYKYFPTSSFLSLREKKKVKKKKDHRKIFVQFNFTNIYTREHLIHHLEKN